MIDLGFLNKTLNSKNLEPSELAYLESIIKSKEWLLKTDIEKQEFRKSNLRMLLVHFEEDKSIEYQRQTILVTDKIISFLANADFYLEELNSSSEIGKYFLRLYIMLWCEKEYIFLMPGLLGTKVHVPYDIFESLIEKIEQTEEYKLYQLKDLFNQYKKMLSLFELNK